MRSVWIVVRTELLRLIRQPEVLFAIVLAPLLVGLVGFAAPEPAEVVGGGGGRSGDVAPITVIAGPPFSEWVEPRDGLRVDPDAPFPLEGPLEDGDAVARIEVDGDEVELEVRLDLREGWRVEERVDDVVARVRRQARDEALAARGIDATYRQLLRVETVSVTGAPEASEDPLEGKLSGVLVFTLVVVAATVGLDIMTAEKERKTMETLLVTRQPRQVFVIAKGIVTLGSTVFAGWLGLAATAGLAALGYADDLGLAAFGGFALLVVGWALQIVPVVMVVSAAAPDYRTGTLLTVPTMLFPTFLAGLAAFPDLALSPLSAWLPIANLALLGRGLAAGTVEPLAGGLALVASVGFAAASIWGAARLLDREAAFLPRGSDPRAGDVVRAAGAWALAVVLAGFFGGTAQTLDALWGTVFVQVVVFGGVALGATGFLGLPVRETLSLRTPTLRDAALALAVALALPLVGQLVFVLQEPVIPVHPELLDQLAELTLPGRPVWVVLLAFALLPAVFEELLFRGLLLGLLARARLRPVARVGLVAVAFGLTHLLWPRILPTAVVGLVLGFVVVRSGSLWLAIVVHGIYNGLLLVASREDVAIDGAPGWAMGLASAVVIPAIAGIRGAPTRIVTD